ncbi:hypothetical protein BD408DRAFT_422966, partial [Parasitella parasitica]
MYMLFGSRCSQVKHRFPPIFLFLMVIVDGYKDICGIIGFGANLGLPGGLLVGILDLD